MASGIGGVSTGLSLQSIGTGQALDLLYFCSSFVYLLREGDEYTCSNLSNSEDYGPSSFIYLLTGDMGLAFSLYFKLSFNYSISFSEA